MGITNSKTLQVTEGHGDLKERNNIFSLANMRQVLVGFGAFTENPRGTSSVIMVSAVTCEKGTGKCKDPA